MKPVITLSRHAKDRLRERHLRHLGAPKDEREFNIACYDLLDNKSAETRRHINDTAFMLFFQEKYGFDKKYSFREYKNVLFVIIDETCVTVLDTDVHRMSRQHGSKKKY